MAERARDQDPDQLHNAVCDASCPETFKSGPSAPKGSVGSHRFVKEGTYRYHCELHPNMVGFVVVTGAAPTTTTAPGATTTTSPHATTSSSTTSTTAPVVLTTEPTTTTAVPAIVASKPEPTSNDKNDSRKIALGSEADVDKAVKAARKAFTAWSQTSREARAAVLERILAEYNKRSADLGVKLGYHNHMGSLGESPEEVDRVMDVSDPRYVKLELDIAHYLQGGGDPVKAIRKYRDRLLFVHIKDVETIPKEESSRGRDFRFVELGRGRVDVPAAFKALEEVRFRGWAVIELDEVPDRSRSPKDSALISKNYLHDHLGFSL